MMSERERLIELLKASLQKHIDKSCKLAENITDDLLANNVRVELPRNDVSMIDGHIEK